MPPEVYLGYQKYLFKAALCSFFGVKNDPKYIFEKMHNQPVFKAICLPFKAVSL